MPVFKHEKSCTETFGTAFSYKVANKFVYFFINLRTLTPDLL